MERFTFNDRYIKGDVVFEQCGDRLAHMSYVGSPRLPLNAFYEINGNKWKVTGVQASDFNPSVVNVDLEIVSD